MKLCLVGSPESPRSIRLIQAATPLGIQVEVFSWHALLEGQPQPVADVVKIDAPTLTPQLVWGLIHKADPSRPRTERDPGLRHSALMNRGFQGCLAELRADRWFSPPADIVVLADKAASHQVFLDAGVPVPEAVSASLPLEGEGLFVKLRWGASAAGIVAIERDRGLRAYTTMIPDNDAFYSSRRVRCTTDAAEIEALLDWLVHEGAHCERWCRKARWNGEVFDLRIVTIAGQPTHVVGRASTGAHPFTNLNLGGRRLSDLPRFEEALEVARVAAACVPRCHVIGFDVMLTEAGPVLIEANPFGDLVNDVLHDGLDTYQAQLLHLNP